MPMRCPRCAGPPVAAVLREEGHGAKRFLLCALCLREWECLRIVCPACGEQEFDKLPVYTAEQFAHVRIDACDRCHHYIKTIDLTKDGLAVPCVDDIASVSLDLWARERGYTRIRTTFSGSDPVNSQLTTPNSQRNRSNNGMKVEPTSWLVRFSPHC